MWEGLREICQRKRCNLHQICISASLQKAEDTSLTAAIRVFVMLYFRHAATDEGHSKAGHGYGLTLGLKIEGRNFYGQHTTAMLTKTSFV